MSLVPRGTNELSSPWIQAGRLAFLALYAVTVLAALAWAFSNVRQIDPQNRAVVLHFGAHPPLSHCDGRGDSEFPLSLTLPHQGGGKKKAVTGQGRG